MKRSTEGDLEALLDARDAEPCPECGAEPGHDHKSWCLNDDTSDDWLNDDTSDD
ncbi:MAG: hypothetical protein WHS89_06095 [Acidimicrobiales bacterium]|jgi:hypothetical protein